MSIHQPKDLPAASAQYQLVIPDEARMISIPILRSAFVKKVYGLKLTNGMVTENAIHKPSEIEGFIGIPIKIGKALASIPAQLFQFKIERINRQTTLETTQQSLMKAQLQTKKDQLSSEAELLKAKIEAQKTTLTFEGEITKIKLEAEKNLLVSQKDVLSAQKDLLDAKKDLEDARKKLEELLKKSGG